MGLYLFLTQKGEYRWIKQIPQSLNSEGGQPNRNDYGER